MQVWVVAIPPTRELADLEAVAVLCRLAAGAAALSDEPLHQQSVAPEDGSGCCCVEHSTDKGQRPFDLFNFLVFGACHHPFMGTAKGPAEGEAAQRD